MSEVAAPISAVNATSTADAPESQAPQSNKAKLEKVLWSVNDPESDIINGKGPDAPSEAAPKEKTMGQIVDDVTNADKKQVKQPTQETETPKELAKRKFKFDGKEIELTEDRFEAYVQKGMLLDKKGHEISKHQMKVEAMMAQAQEREQTAQQTLKALETGSLDVLVHLHGPEKARAMMEQYLTPLIQEEMLPPEQREHMQLKRAHDQAIARLEAIEQEKANYKLEQDTVAAKQQYETTIMKALELGGVPKNEFTASEAAQFLQIGLDKGIEISPEQLSQLVKGNNQKRISAMTENYTAKIMEAQKAGDHATILKCGEALAEMLGEKVVYALGKYHYNKIKTAKPELPKATSDVAKQQINNEQPKRKMTEDEARRERLRRVAILEQGGDPGPA